MSSYAYTYDDNGNRESQIETNGGTSETTTYSYDDLNRLATITYPTDTEYPSGRVVEYAYDGVGNRVHETATVPGSPSPFEDKQGIFDTLNRLSELNDLIDPTNSESFDWDDNGNQIARTIGTGPGAVTTLYVYDVRDKLAEVQQGAGALARFQYDFEGRRNLKVGTSGVRQYVYDETSLFAEYDSGGSQTLKYDYGSDRLISLTHHVEGRRYFSLDGLRSVVNLTDDGGSTIASYHLDAWGNFRFPNELDASRNRFAFTGHYYDEETKLYNAKARYFDPKLGRFLTQDSYLGQIDEPPSLHRYLYAGNRPDLLRRSPRPRLGHSERSEERGQSVWRRGLWCRGGDRLGGCLHVSGHRNSALRCGAFLLPREDCTRVLGRHRCPGWSSGREGLGPDSSGCRYCARRTLRTRD